MIACYTDRLSVAPGETFQLHASAPGPCRLEIARVGAERQTVYQREALQIGSHALPRQPDRDGCGWPAALEVTVGGDWTSGYYDIVLEDAGGERAHHFVVVRAKPAKAKAVLVLSTNTYHAYNWWGGANAYCDVTSLMTAGMPLPQAMEGAIGVLSTHRPFAPLLVAAPEDVPRLVNARKRGYEERPWASDTDWARKHRVSPYDRSAGFLNKWEHVFVRWAECEGLMIDYLTDYDLGADAGALAPYDVVILVGHSEYWSAGERDAIERFVDRGGRLAIFSGNTAFWKVRHENDGRSFVCHKWRGFDAEPNAGRDATHLWSHPVFARPEAEITGLSFLFAGYHRLGLCAARGQGGYTVYRNEHWALEGCDLFYGDVIGDELPLIGYENDGCRFTFGNDGLPQAIAHLGVPENLEIIALAPCAFGEPPSGYRPLIPPEKLDAVAEIMFGDASAASQVRVLRGHAAMASFKRGKGEVFNGGTTEWAHALAARDPFIERITRNVLRRFGAL
ncbi:MAG: DUF4350 domain-containing protein [Alphaproteobacteria bacterium]|nr:DUF4350 domain-containing protein [Alphaproteobacteria bacterium]